MAVGCTAWRSVRPVVTAASFVELVGAACSELLAEQCHLEGTEEN